MPALPVDWPGDEHRTAMTAEEKPRDCLHCGSPLDRFWRPQDGPFCCRGCRSVYELIQNDGLTRYYDLRQGTQPPAASLRLDSLAWLDRMVEALPPTEREQGPWQLSLDIQGVHCAACVWLIEELFRREPGGVNLRINPTLGTVDLAWDPTQGELRNYLASVEKFGYRLGPAQKQARRTSRGLLVRMAICVAAALNVMMFSLSYYFGLAPQDGAIYHFFGWLSLALGTLATAVGGQVFFRGAVAGLRARVAHLDLPISLGIVLAWAGSVGAFLARGPRAAYFDTLTVFITLMLVGRWAQQHVLERNRNALLYAAGADQLTVKRRDAGGLQAVAATVIDRGDELWIAPGDVMPVDGVLLRQAAEVSLDWITGESDRVAREPGEVVQAGAFNLGKHGFAATAVESFAASRLQELLRAPAERGGDFRPVWWHRVSSIYVSAVLFAAAAGFALWLPHGLGAALPVVVAVLVVTCPCALGLATPLAEELVHHALRRRGVLLRQEDFLEKALRVRKILLDKTGTLTLGELATTPNAETALADLSGDRRAILLEMTARSNHPVSRCLAAALRARRCEDGAVDAGLAVAAEAVREHPGQGLSLAHGGHGYRLGRPAFVTGARDDAADDLVTMFGVDGTVLARLPLREDLKADAASEVAALQRAGYDLHLLSGDAPARVRAAAVHLGIAPAQALGGLSPEAKAARVRALDDRDTLMVGDGLNDSPAFAAALCAATPAVDRPVLPGKADFYFLGDGIAALRRALFAARHLRSIVRVNLAIAAVYNLAAVALCLAGLVTPVVAAILMPLSSVTVVTLTAYRLTGRRLAWMS